MSVGRFSFWLNTKISYSPAGSPDIIGRRSILIRHKDDPDVLVGGVTSSTSRCCTEYRGLNSQPDIIYKTAQLPAGFHLQSGRRRGQLPAGVHLQGGRGGQLPVTLTHKTAQLPAGFHLQGGRKGQLPAGFNLQGGRRGQLQPDVFYRAAQLGRLPHSV